jgi:hypothetical protein
VLREKTALSRQLKISLLNCIFGFLCSVTIKNYFVTERIILKLIPPGSGMRPLSVRKEISSGIDTHLLFTIYDLLFTIIILKANRWVFNK